MAIFSSHRSHHAPSILDGGRRSNRRNEKGIKAAVLGFVHLTFSDGSAVVCGDDGRSYRIPNDVVSAAGLYNGLRGRRVRIDLGDADDIATSVALA